MDAEKSRPASIRDVAARAGVSRQTVSRVLNGLPGMTDETAERVRQVMKQLDYSPNRAARILASSRHRTIGLITTGSTMFGPASIKEAIERAARSHGYVITAVTVVSEGEADIAEGLDELMAHGVDGMIVIAPQERTWPLIQARLGSKPSLQWRGGPANTVPLEQREGALLAVRHLTGLGHRRIRHLAGPMHWAEVEQRVYGYRQALLEAELTALPIEHGDWSADSGYAIGLRILPERDATAVFVSNDQMAIGLLHAAHELGIDVPSELSIVGFDDTPEARHATPPLTTVRLDFGALGEAAITRIVALIEGRPAPDRDMSDQVALQIRESTAPPFG